jgi:3-hydroxyisobutyrate dehydrogenase
VSGELVGFVGIGNAGRPMARHLTAAGYELLAHDADRERAAAFAAEHGCRAAVELADLAAASILFTMLPDGTVVRSILLGPQGLAERLAPGTVVIDTSSSDPQGTRELCAELAQRGIALIDAAVSVPVVRGAEVGRITFMVGADDEGALARARPLLETMSEHIFHLGPTGTGHTMKTLNNYVSAAGLYAALDALVIGCEYGLDPMAMLNVLNVSTGRNFSTEETLKYHAVPRDFNTGYTLALLVKDLRIAASVAQDAGFDAETFGLLLSGFEEAVADLGGDADLTAALLHWEHRAGLELPARDPARG